MNCTSKVVHKTFEVQFIYDRVGLSSILIDIICLIKFVFKQT